MRGEYICRVDAMGKITSAETQKALRTMTGEEAYVTVIGILNELPAADVHPVVRCGECRNHHWHQEPCHGKTVHTCSVLNAEVFREFFCGYGERKAMYEKFGIEVTEI